MTWLNYFGEFFIHQFLPGFCQHLFLLALCVLMVLLVCGKVGKGLGIPLLIWHEKPWKRFFGALAITLFFAEVFFVGFLLAGYVRHPELAGAAAAKEAQQPGRPVPNAPVLLEKGWHRWVPPPLHSSSLDDVIIALCGHLLAMTTILLVGFALVLVWGLLKKLFGTAGAGPPGPIRPQWPPMFLLGILAGLIVVGLIIVGMNGLLTSSGTTSPRTWFSHLARWVRYPFLYMYPSEEFSGERDLHVVAALGGLLLLLAYWFCSRDRTAAYVTPVASICALLGLLAGIYGFVVFWLVRSLGDVPWVTAAALLLFVLLLVGGIARYKTRFADLGYRSPQPLEDYDPHRATPVLLRDDLQGDGQGKPEYRRNPAGKRPLALVCVSGGASRAAVWTAAILQELDRQIPGFSYHVRLVTGASGGLVGAAYHVAALQEPEGGDPDAPHPCRFKVSPQEMVDRLADDSLSPVIHRLAFTDFLALFSPVPLPNDRGRGLEEAWKVTLQGGLDVSLRQLVDGERAGWRPSLVFSPMLVEDGRRLLISNLDLNFLTTNEWNCLHGVNAKSTSRSDVEFFKLFPEALDFRLATAARMSASYPYLSPATTLPTSPRRRVVDAAYYDNYGVNLAASWLHVRRPWLRQHVSRVVLVQIRDSLSEDDRNKVARPLDASSWLSRGLEEVGSPLEAVLRARESVMSYRNDEQLEFLSYVFNHEFGEGYFTTVLFENPAEVSMSWYVPEQEKQQLLTAVQGTRIQDRIGGLARWWTCP